MCSELNTVLLASVSVKYSYSIMIYLPASVVGILPYVFDSMSLTVQEIVV